MSVDAYYNEAWAGGEEYGDPLTGRRYELLWRLADAAGVGGGRLLDVGCGEGGLLAEAAARGYTVAGTDIAESVLERARRRVPDAELVAHNTDTRPWPLAQQGFDLVTAFEIIEHVYFARQLLMGCRDCLRPGGRLALSTPYHGRLKNVALALHGYDRHYWVEGQHIRFFTDRALRDLVTSCGFAVEAVHHLGRAPYLWNDTFVWARRVEGDVEDPGAMLRNPPDDY